MLKITPIEEPKLVRLRCPKCNTKISNVGLLKDQSRVEGLIFRCRKCEVQYSVETNTNE